MTVVEHDCCLIWAHTTVAIVARRYPFSRPRKIRPMNKAERNLRTEIIAQCRWMNASGLNQGTSGNISARHGDTLLITPSATPYDKLEPQMIAALPLDGGGTWSGPLTPSTEWRFHFDIMRRRPEVGAIVHTHSTFATAVAITRQPIPACHYMVAAFGGNDVKCAGYARYGTQELSDLVLQALEGRNSCLLANHGAIATGPDLAKAMWLAVELEALAKQYVIALQIGSMVVLKDAEIDEVRQGFQSYGLQQPAKPKRASAKAGGKRPALARR